MRISIQHLKEMKKRRQKIVMLTAYDYQMAQILDGAEVPVILVGDSLGNVILGYDTTIPVTVNDMIHHTKAVVRGSKKAMVVADMPFMSYQASNEEAIRNAGRILKETGAQAVKLEGGLPITDRVKAIVEAGIPVMGHIGLTPQSVYQLGGYKAQGKTLDAAKRLASDAKALEDAGAFAIVVETIPSELACHISQSLSIPVIGIGAGLGCDGQVQVIYDILGMFGDYVPKHTRQYARLATNIFEAVKQFSSDVHAESFPSDKECISMGAVFWDALRDNPA